MSFLKKMGLQHLDPHHKLDHVGHKVEHTVHHAGHSVTHAIETDVKKIHHELAGGIHSVEHTVDGVTHKITGGINDINKFIEHLPDEIKHVAMEVVDKAREEAKEVAIKVLGKGAAIFIKCFMSGVHHLLPDQDQGFELFGVGIMWSNIHEKADQIKADLEHFYHHPPHKVEDLIDFAKHIQPTYLQFKPNAELAEVFAATNVLGGALDMKMDVLEFEKFIAKGLHQLHLI